MKFLIADDHSMLRKGLIQILADEFSKAEFHEADNIVETLELLASGQWDILLLDIFMPGRSGLEVLRITQAKYPHLPILVVSSAPEEQLAVRVLKAGAWGYINKQAAPKELIKACGKILAGSRYVSDSIAEKIALGLSRDPKLAHDNLSDREYEVLQLIVSGQSIKEIAAELSLSAKTISTFHTRIWEKLGVNNDIALIQYVIEHGLLNAKPKL